MVKFDITCEHAALTTQATDEMIVAGAARIKAERAIFAKEGWGEPSDEHLAANVYEAMVYCVIKRGLYAEGTNMP